MTIAPFYILRKGFWRILAILCLAILCLAILWLTEAGLVPLSALPAPAKPSDCPAAPEFHLKFIEFKKVINGQASQTLELVNRAGAGEVHVLFREGEAPDLFEIQPVNGEIKILGSRRRLIRVYAFGRAKGQTRDRVFTASASFFLWGNSKAAVQRIPAGPRVLATMAGLPFVSLSPDRGSYWPQTGQTFRFQLHQGLPGGPTLPAGFQVVGKGTLRTLPEDTTYIPAHDPALNRQGAAAFRQDIVFTDMIIDDPTYGGHAAQASYTLKLHRSRTAQDNHTAGWAAMGASLCLFSGWVWIKRRRPWWKR